MEQKSMCVVKNICYLSLVLVSFSLIAEQHVDSTSQKQLSTSQLHHGHKKGKRGIPGQGNSMSPQGRTGPTGPTGPMGFQGPMGSGNTGPKGQDGPEGPTGPLGIGPIGDEGYKGATGDTGEIGPKGAMGYDGATGEIGNTGPTGLTGEQGPEGQQGAPGETGLTGFIGYEGPTGPAGLSAKLGYTSRVLGSFSFKAKTQSFSYQVISGGSWYVAIFCPDGTKVRGADVDINTGSSTALPMEYYEVTVPGPIQLGQYKIAFVLQAFTASGQDLFICPVARGSNGEPTMWISFLDGNGSEISKTILPAYIGDSSSWAPVLALRAGSAMPSMQEFTYTPFTP